MQVPEFEANYLKSIKPSFFKNINLKSGTYTLEINIPEKQTIFLSKNINFLNNQPVQPKNNLPNRTGFNESITIEKNVITWHHEGMLYDGGVWFVGTISGNTMFGHVYNYQQNPKGEIGFWSMYPKNNNEILPKNPNSEL